MSLFDDALNKRKAALLKDTVLTGITTLQYISSASPIIMYINGSSIVAVDTSAFRPTFDNARNLGTAAIRWSNVYAATGTINTSDERAKQQISGIPEEWLRAWGEVEYVRFKFNDAVELKGDAARWHIGLIAQRVKLAFEKHGINPFEIGILCFDEWDDQYNEIEEESTPVVKAGNRYGIRYEQALALECAYLRWKLGI